MFTIYGGKTELNQWDLEQRVMEPRLVAGDKVIFLNSSGMTYPMKAYSYNGEVVVDVPNKLLTMAVPVLMYVNGYYETRTSFNVVAREKPEDYVFVDNDDWSSDEGGADSGNKTMEILDLSDYGINMMGAMVQAMSGQTFTEIDCSAFIRDASRVVEQNKVPLFYEPTLGVYGFVTGIGLDTQLITSMVGNYGGTFMKADVVFLNEGIHLFLSVLNSEASA